MRRLPFALSPKKEIVPVGDDKVGIIYLEKIKGRKAIEREQLDQVDVIKTNAQLLLLKLARKISEDKKIPTDKALELVLGGESENDILMEYTDEVENMIALRKEADSLKNTIANCIIKSRIAYPVTVRNSSSNSQTLEIEPLGFELSQGSQLKFGSVILTVESDVNVGSEFLTFTTATSLSKNDVGFLFDSQLKTEVVGDNLWSDEDTSSLPDSLVEAINAFYELESAGGEMITEKKEASKNQSKSSKTTSQES
jgi:hypothetical protein